jgi:5'-3' exonuclease
MKNLGDFKPYEVMYIDAMNLSMRDYYGISDLEYHGRKTGMLYGIARLFIEWQKRAPGIEIVMLWEGRDSWRKAKYPIYKAHRGEERSAEDTKEFFDCVERVKYALPVMGIKQAWCHTYEADDVVANLVMSEFRKTLLSSGDWDWWELAKYGDILYQHKDILTVGEMGARFAKKFNAPMVPFDKLWLFKVLCGDESDKVSGVPWFPRKLASALCNLEGVDAGSLVHGLIRLGAKKWAERVRANMWIIDRNIELLHTSEIPLKDIEWVDGDYSVEKFGDVLLKSGMENLYDRFMGGIK